MSRCPYWTLKYPPVLIDWLAQGRGPISCVLRARPMAGAVAVAGALGSRGGGDGGGAGRGRVRLGGFYSRLGGRAGSEVGAAGTAPSRS